jgi:hypothetical protein
MGWDFEGYVMKFGFMAVIRRVGVAWKKIGGVSGW